MIFHVETPSSLKRVGVVASMLVLLLVAGISPATALPPEEADDEKTSDAAEEEERTEPEQTDYSETVVVTASRTEQTLQDTPAAVSVIEGKQIVQAPVDDYGDILRNVAGSNTVQMNARDILFTSRAATSVIPAGQLAMVDNRTIYQDYNGFVMWDTVPLDPYEIKRVEAVRGPGSAVWRQRRQRHRQHHHQVASGDAGDEGDAGWRRGRHGVRQRDPRRGERRRQGRLQGHGGLLRAGCL
jgi:outer membrane receptor protein involved in Fe transport